MATIKLYCLDTPNSGGKYGFRNAASITIDYTTSNGIFTINSIYGDRSDGYDSYYSAYDQNHYIAFPGGSGYITTKAGSGAKNTGIGFGSYNSNWYWSISGAPVSFASSGGTGQITMTTTAAGNANINGATWASLDGSRTGSTVTINIPSPISKPSGVSGSANNITSSSATISGSCSNWGGETGTYSLVNVSSGTVSGMNITGLSPATTYTYQVRATNSAGSTDSSILSFTTVAGKPTNLTRTTQINTNSITITPSCSWNGNTGTYSIKQASSGTISGMSIIELQPNTSVTYTIAATNSAGTTTAQYTDKTLYAAPSNINVSTSATQNTITVSATADWGGYSTGTFTIVENSGGTVSGMTLTGLSSNTTYTFKVKATNDTGSTTSSLITVKTQAKIPTSLTNVIVANSTEDVYCTVEGDFDTGVSVDWSQSYAEYLVEGQVYYDTIYPTSNKIEIVDIIPNKQYTYIMHMTDTSGYSQNITSKFKVQCDIKYNGEYAESMRINGKDQTECEINNKTIYCHHVKYIN